ncbi:MAG: hypothetical protein ACPGLY_27290 [Rubripirellula sp.]
MAKKKVSENKPKNTEVEVKPASEPVAVVETESGNVDITTRAEATAKLVADIEIKPDRMAVQEMFHAAMRAMRLGQPGVTLFPLKLIQCGCDELLTATQKDRFIAAVKEGQKASVVFDFPPADVVEVLKPLMDQINCCEEAAEA